MDTPRKRGRPVGSRNKPKTNPSEINVQTWKPTFTEQIDLTKPLGLYPEPLYDTNQPGFRFHVSFKGSFGPAKDEWEEDIYWPRDWPFPQLGQNITLDDGKGGIVSHVTFDLKQDRIHVRLSS